MNGAYSSSGHADIISSGHKVTQITVGLNVVCGGSNDLRSLP
jgi:hypothetical protein